MRGATIACYEKHLGAKLIAKMTWAEMPGAPSLPPGMTADMILHARFTVGDTLVMASDGPKVEPMRSAYLALSVDSNEEAERIYAVLTDGGQVFMKMEETFFAHRFGQFRDKFRRELDGDSREADAAGVMTKSTFEIFPEGVGKLGAELVGHAAGGALDFFHEAVKITAGAGDGGDAERSRLVDDSLVQFSNGHVEALLQLVFERADHLAPVLERLGVLDAKLESELSYGHGALN